MAALGVFVSVLVVTCAIGTTEQLNMFQTADIIAAHGYPSETHHVTTSDGYILEMHRIPHGINQSPSANRPVVFLMHGLTAASNAYILLGPQHAPAYNLADSGFDIWMGNARGNRNSRFHITLDPDHPTEKIEFFNFTFEEIAIHDLPAMIDYVLQYTGQEQLHYIGHSQGGTVFLILNSMRPEYNDKIKSAHLLAGVGYQDYFPNTELSGIALLTDIIWNMALLAGFVEMFPPESANGASEEEGLRHCTGDERTAYMCNLVGVKHLMRLDTHEVDLDSVFEDYESAGAALKQIAHYGQNIRDKAFRRWSHGLFQNLAVYGDRNPPAYNLGLITINTTMHYTVNDNLLDERDVLAMADDMPNTSVRKVARESFLHEDFVAALDAKELVTDYIIEAIRRDSGWSGENAGGGTDSDTDIDTDTDTDIDTDADTESSPVTPAPAADPPTAAPGSAAHNLVLSNTMYLIALSIYLFMYRM